MPHQTATTGITDCNSSGLGYFTKWSVEAYTSLAIRKKVVEVSPTIHTLSFQDVPLGCPPLPATELLCRRRTVVPFDGTLRALLRGDGGVHPAVLHHVVRRTETEIVHMIGNIGPAMYYARRNDQHVTDLQLDFA